MSCKKDGKRCKVLIAGVGSIGERHVRCFLATGQAEVTEQIKVDSGDRDHSLICQAEELLNAIATGRPGALCSLTEGVQTQQALESIMGSTARPRWFTIPQALDVATLATPCVV